MSEKSTTSHLYNLTLNTILHVALLFLIISLFFFVYVSKLSEHILNNEINGNISAKLRPMLQKMNEDSKNNLYLATRNIPYATLNDLYSQPYQSNLDNNEWLKIVVIIINIALFIIVFLLIIIPFNFGSNVPIGKILEENLVVFLCVGIIELSFFYYVAQRFVPAPPSALVMSLQNSLVRNFQSKK